VRAGTGEHVLPHPARHVSCNSPPFEYITPFDKESPVKRFIVLGVIGILVAPALVAAQQQPAAAASPTSLQPATPYRVVDLKHGTFVIDQPGNYVLTRSWSFRATPDQPRVVIDVVANDVVLDFRGFEVEVEGVSGAPSITIVNVQGNGFTLKNAVVQICCEGGFAVRSTGIRTELEHLSGFTFERVLLEGNFAVIRDSSFSARAGVDLGSWGTIMNTFVSCRAGCVELAGNNSKLLNTRIQPADFLGVRIVGSGNVLAGNLIDFFGGGPQLTTAFDVQGDKNVLQDNTLSTGGETGVAVNVSGTANVIESNVVALAADGGIVATGIRFARDGNFYGDNRVTAAVPFELGGTVQTDWGGNVGY
jgi:hypothetical protein